jgi:hypothetical protein
MALTTAVLLRQINGPCTSQSLPGWLKGFAHAQMENTQLTDQLESAQKAVYVAQVRLGCIHAALYRRASVLGHYLADCAMCTSVALFAHNAADCSAGAPQLALSERVVIWSCSC